LSSMMKFFPVMSAMNLMNTLMSTPSKSMCELSTRVHGCLRIRPETAVPSDRLSGHDRWFLPLRSGLFLHRGRRRRDQAESLFMSSGFCRLKVLRGMTVSLGGVAPWFVVVWALTALSLQAG
jgi:hypothetical protein